jgi:outer membrane protein assembly factor BamA
MKKTLSTLLVSLMILTLSAQETKTKTGWSLGPLPAISFDSDLGFQYGGLLNLWYYGKGDIYPKYYHFFYIEASHYMKGSGIFRVMYDSEHLIPGVRYTVDLSYLPDEALDFYGFNGYDAVIHKGWANKSLFDGSEYKSRMFYRYKRTLLRFKNDFQGKLYGEHLRWSAGFSIQNFNISSVNIDKMNKGKSDKLQPVTDVPGLYELYKSDDWGIIKHDEADGGLINTVKVGLTYDSRDNQPNPMKGVWIEAGVETSQEFLGSEASFGKFFLTHRQYFTLIPRNLSFAYRLGFQQTIFGTVPFYYQSQLITSYLRGATSEGLGGSKSLRGVWRNRVVGDGFFYGNAELRWKAVHFTFLKNPWYLGVNGFSDFGMVTKKIDVNIPSNLIYTKPDGTKITYYKDDFFSNNAEKMHVSIGAGIRIVMNENFIIAVDYGRAFKDQDGGTGFYVGLNYLF